MSKPGAVNFPRINLISLLAGALALASVFLPWWGIDASGFGSSVSSRWTLWNGPSTDSIFRGSTQPYPTLTSASPIIGALVVISALLALAGSFTAYRISGSGQLRCRELLRWSVELSERTLRHRNLFWNYSELGLPNRLLSLPFCWSSDVGRAGLPSNLPQDNSSTRDSPSFCGNELGSGPNCEADCRRARVCSKLAELPTIEPVLVLCQRRVPTLKPWFS